MPWLPRTDLGNARWLLEVAGKKAGKTKLADEARPCGIAKSHTGCQRLLGCKGLPKLSNGSGLSKPQSSYSLWEGARSFKNLRNIGCVGLLHFLHTPKPPPSCSKSFLNVFLNNLTWQHLAVEPSVTYQKVKNDTNRESTFSNGCW